MQPFKSEMIQQHFPLKNWDTVGRKQNKWKTIIYDIIYDTLSCSLTSIKGGYFFGHNFISANSHTLLLQIFKLGGDTHGYIKP